MNIILLASAIFLGLLAGLIIANFTKEEISANRRYFILTKYLLLLVLSLTVIYFYKDHKFWYIYFLLGIIIGYFLRILFLYLGIILGSTINLDNNKLLIVSSIIFLFGLIYSCNYVGKSKRFLIILIIINYLLLLISTITTTYIYSIQLILIVSGALLGNIIYSSFKIDSKAFR